MKPFKLKPCYKNYIWGGNKLRNNYGKESDLNVIAESWELSAHEDGSSVISECFDEGIMNMPFRKFTESYPAAVGTKVNGRFPILIKLIDAKDNLSVQVHPDDDFAAKYESSPGKTEMWYVLEHEKDAFIYMGLNKDMSKSEFREAVLDGSILSALNKIHVKKGDAFFIEAGTVHAINKGIVIAEIQQSSNITYRVYDYNRAGADGKKRELHIDKAVDAANLKKYVPYSALKADDTVSNCKLLASCGYFTVKSVDTNGGFSFNMGEEAFASILTIDGMALLEHVVEDGETCAIHLLKGDSVFIPAGKARVSIHGDASIVITTP